MTNWITNVKQAIQKSDVKEALKLFAQHNQNSSIENTLIILTARWNRLRNSEISGIVSADNANIEKNRISYAVLSLLDDVSDDAAQTTSQPGTTNHTVIHGDGNIVIQGVTGGEIHIHK